MHRDARVRCLDGRARYSHLLLPCMGPPAGLPCQATLLCFGPPASAARPPAIHSSDTLPAGPTTPLTGGARCRQLRQLGMLHADGEASLTELLPKWWSRVGPSAAALTAYAVD